MARCKKVSRAVIRTATILVALTLVSASAAPGCDAVAQGGGCSDNCRAAFGACYKSTANRAVCEMQLQRCLEGCIMSKRG